MTVEKRTWGTHTHTVYSFFVLVLVVLVVLHGEGRAGQGIDQGTGHKGGPRAACCSRAARRRLTMMGVCTPGARRKSALVRWDTSWVTCEGGRGSGEGER